MSKDTGLLIIELEITGKLGSRAVILEISRLTEVVTGSESQASEPTEQDT